MKSLPKIVGWVLSGLVGVMLIGLSAPMKFKTSSESAEMFGKMGFTPDHMFNIGVVEIVITLVFLVPQTGFLGAILLTGYLGGATVTHLRVNEPVIAPIIVGVVVWIALGLRQPEIFRMAFGFAFPNKQSNG